jgi:hypothetical protein
MRKSCITTAVRVVKWHWSVNGFLSSEKVVNSLNQVKKFEDHNASLTHKAVHVSYQFTLCASYSRRSLAFGF